MFTSTGLSGYCGFSLWVRLCLSGSEGMEELVWDDLHIIIVLNWSQYSLYAKSQFNWVVFTSTLLVILFSDRSEVLPVRNNLINRPHIIHGGRISLCFQLPMETHNGLKCLASLMDSNSLTRSRGTWCECLLAKVPQLHRHCDCISFPPHQRTGTN